MKYQTSFYRIVGTLGSAASLFTWSLPLCPCVFEASYDPCVVSTVENLKKRLERTSHSWRKVKQIRPASSFSINQRKFSARKDGKNHGFDWQVTIKMPPTPPIRFPVYPMYGFAKPTVAVRGRIFPSAPLCLIEARRHFPWNHFLACFNPLSISSSKMATEQHKDMSALQATDFLGWLLQAFTRNGLQNSHIRLFGISNSLKSRYKVRSCSFL